MDSAILEYSTYPEEAGSRPKTPANWSGGYGEQPPKTGWVHHNTDDPTQGSTPHSVGSSSTGYKQYWPSGDSAWDKSAPIQGGPPRYHRGHPIVHANNDASQGSLPGNQPFNTFEGQYETPRSRYGMWQDNSGEAIRQTQACTSRVAEIATSILGPGVDANLPWDREGNGESRMSVEVRAEIESEQSSNSDEEATPSGGLDHYLLKTLAYILRQGALKLGNRRLSGGYLFVEEILKGHPGLAGYSLPDIHKLVKVDVDKRFTLIRDTDSGCWKIRANQGHSLVVDTPDIPLVEKHEVLQGYHYTTMASWAI
ncbi:TRPT1 [Mytilus coruscus]|uniref:2'-phosphotransferase n=1 Tax=Mytilus coruscus TaxID=42192 RepID=A0A6J8D4N4_MYTCO|nr:TRPT1 [Mytilus coruscus]